jgi:hypothetical protein
MQLETSKLYLLCLSFDKLWGETKFTNYQSPVNQEYNHFFYMFAKNVLFHVS